MPATILLVDDHPIFRQGLYHLLSDEKDLTIVGEADNGEMAIELVESKRPDLVVMDINMPRLDGIAATRQIMSSAPDTKVVALSVHSGKQYVRDMILAGASGYILKESIPEEMVAGIRAVLAGDVYLSKSISKTLVLDYKTLAECSGLDPDETVQDLLYTKLHRPPISASIIPRSELITAIEKGTQNPITLIAASAGYGKSTLASQWFGVSQLPVAWLSLDDGDNQLRVFLRYVIEAIEKVIPGHELKTRDLVMGARLPSAQKLGQSLLNDLEFYNEKVALVLDDYHVIRNNDIHDFITELLAHPSPVLHLVLVARRDPPLPLTALRARGHLTEITRTDLRFTSLETKTYLERILRVTITDKTAQILEGKMEGWVTGLHLAALSLREEPEQDRLIERLQGTSLYVQEYLMREVVSKAPPPFKQHLLQAAILDRFCVALCDALMPGGEDSPAAESQANGQEFIHWLVAMNFFTIPLDGTGHWFRFHHLFQQLLLDQLKQELPPEEIAAFHSRASAWFAQNHLVEEAIRHALAADDAPEAVKIIEQNRHAVLNDDRWYALEQWLPMLPDDIVQQSPGLLLAKIWLFYHHFSLSKIPALIDMAQALLDDSWDEKLDDRSIRSEIEFFSGYFHYFQNDGEASLKHLSAARKLVSQENHEVYGQIEILYGLALQMQGQQAAALSRLQTLFDHPQWEKTVSRTRLQVTVVYIHTIAGNLSQAAVANHQLFSFAAQNNYTYAKAWSLYLAGLIHFFRNELDQAIEHFSQAVELKHILHTRAVIDSMAGLVLAYQAMGKTDHVTDTLHRLDSYVAAGNDPAGATLVQACHARLAIMQGQPGAVSNFLQGGSPPAENMVWWLEIPAVTYCRALIARGDSQSLQQSEARLRELLQLNEANHNTCHMIPIMILLALVCKNQDRTEDALNFLEQALDLAAPGNWVRPFVEAGTPVAQMLKQLPAEKTNDFTAKLMAACDDAGNPSEVVEKPLASDGTPGQPASSEQPLVEPLSYRELDVLELLARRLQNKEIAENLCVTTETVKSHLKNIYQKLGVGTRRKAVDEARRLKIIE